MNILEELGLKYGTDKGTKHHYLTVYYEMFKNSRKEIKKILEIGVAEGAGLRMFRDFFTNAIIYGAENDPSRVFIDPPIQVFRCDQSDAKDLENLINKTGTDLDVVIDDGSHKPKDQIFTCLKVFSYLRPGTIYIIEDVSKEDVVKELRKEGIECDILRVGKRYDDQLIICQKK